MTSPDAIEPTFREFRTNGILIHAAHWEAPLVDLPPVVILHGLWDSWSRFAAVAARLAVERDVYALDLRGHGESEKPETGYTLRDYAGDVSGILHQIPDAEIDLLGHSLGALVAIRLAADHQPRLRRMVLADPLLVTSDDDRPFQRFTRQLLSLKGEPEEQIASELTPLNPTFDAAWHADSARLLKNTADGPFLALAGGTAGIDVWPALLRSIDVPTLILAADPEMGGWLMEHRLEPLRAALPAARVVTIPGAAHHIPASHPDAFVREVEDFLTRDIP